MSPLFARVRSFWRGVRRPDPLWAEMGEEMRFHVEMEAERLQRERGLDLAEARRQAAVAFGGVEKYREAGRDARGLGWLGGLMLDLKLGGRLLVKYPGLTIVGGLAMAFAVWAGAVTFQMMSLFVFPTLPLPDGDRIVQIQNWNIEATDEEPPTLYDFVFWRNTLRSVTDLGAFRDVTRNLITDDGNARPVQVAEITASAFRIDPSPPLLGRVLRAADERADAQPVVVLGHEVWRTRFASDPGVVGHSVQIGDTYTTVVGVMPEGFEFPVAHHLWMPLRPDALDPAPGAAPPVTVFGRLAPGVSLEEAQAELTTIGRAAASELPATHARLLPRVSSYAKLLGDFGSSELGPILAIYLFPVLLLVLVCSNVALLMFARAATRERELVARSALGASRARISMQLFAEALVLGVAAAVVGLAAAHLSLRLWGGEYLEINLGELPFWFDITLSPVTVLYALGLTVLGAAIAGVLPALKVTRGLGARLRQATAGGGGLQFGGVWTAVIITQVAFTVAFPSVVYIMQREFVRVRSFEAGFPTEEYLGLLLAPEAAADGGASAGSGNAGRGARFGASLEALRQRVAAEPGVRGVTFVDQLPGDWHWETRIELDDPSRDVRGAQSGSPAGPTLLPEVATAAVDPSYFDVVGAPILAGRGFHSGDLAREPRVVIVDQVFVDSVMLGRNPIGQRVRFAVAPSLDGEPPEESPWLEIVGIVEKLGMGAIQSQNVPGLYLPEQPGASPDIHMIVHAQGDPMALLPRIRALATAVDPTLGISNPLRLDEVTNSSLWFLGFWVRSTMALTAIALLLSLAGIYAVLSFTVARRTRDIGIRVALGANPWGVVAAIFRRPLTQVCVGVVAGGALIAAASFVQGDGVLVGSGLTRSQAVTLLGYVALMFGVCLLACVIPTRRALGVEPMMAMREE